MNRLDEGEQADKTKATPAESGYYWCYTLDNEGNPLESEGKPSVVWYQCGVDSSRDEVQLLGYDVALAYSPEKYRLLGRIEY